MGLNDDFLSDAEKEELIEVGPAPELLSDDNGPKIEEDVENIQALESEINGLRYVLESIKITGGMSRKIAMEAEAVHPGFLSDEVPLTAYSNVATATRYKASLEEISVAIWAAIVAGIAALAAIIYKFVKWIRGGKGDGDSSGFDFDAADKANGKDTAAGELKKIVEEVAADDKESAKLLHAPMSSALSQAEKLGVNTPLIELAAHGINPIAGEILYNGKFFQTIEKLSAQFVTWPEEFDKSSKRLEHVVSQLVKTDGKINYEDRTVLAFIKEYNVAVANKDFKRLHGLLGSSVNVFESGREYTLPELKDKLIQDIHEVEQRDVVKIPSIDQAIKLAVEFKRVKVAQNLEAAFGKKTTAVLEDISKRISSISNSVNAAGKQNKDAKAAEPGVTKDMEDECYLFFKNVVSNLSTSFNAYSTITMRILKVMSDGVRYTDGLVSKLLNEYMDCVNIINGVKTDKDKKFEEDKKEPEKVPLEESSKLKGLMKGFKSALKAFRTGYAEGVTEPA